MWGQLRPADIERAKRQLANYRIEIRTRHAEELKRLDAEQMEIETFERAVAAFAKKHLEPVPVSSVPTGSEEQPTPTAEPEEPHTPEARFDRIPPRLQVHHVSSPNFGVPFRRLVSGG